MALTKISGSILKDPLNLGEVSIGGTLTYQDVTNVDSIGIGTFRDGINVIGHTELDNVNVSGISTFGGDIQVPDKIIHAGDTNTALRFPSADTITAETGGSERIRITSGGVIGINDNNPGSGKKVKVVVANNSSYQMAVNLTNNVNADINFYIKTNESLIAPSTSTPLCLGTGGAEKLRITSTGQLLLMSNTGYNPSSSLFSLATDASAAANMLSDSSSIYNHNNPAFVHVQNMNNTGDGQEAGIILHSKSSFGGAWAIYGKRTTSGFKSDLIFRGRTGSSSSAERLRITSDGILILNASTAASGPKLAIQSTASSGSGTATGIRVGNNIGALSVYPANLEVRTTGVSDYNAIRTDAGDGNGGFTCGVEGYNGFLNLTTGGSNVVNVKLHTSGVSYLNGGNIGINSTVPSKKLDVRGNTIANQFLARSLPTSSYTTSTTGFKYGARGSYALSIGGNRSGNSSSFTICDIKDFNNSKFFRIEISFAHAGGGIHGSYRRMAGICNGYTSIQTWSDTGNVNTGGGGGFTISKPDNHTLRIVWNGASSYADHYTLYCLVNVSYEGSYFSYIDSAFY